MQNILIESRMQCLRKEKMKFEEWLDKRFPVIQTPGQKAILKDGVEITKQEYQLMM
jgi:hypothetical protein